jgi:hypothetical protein
MTNKELAITLVNSILRVLDQVDPRHRSRHRRGRQGVPAHRQEPGVTLDLEQLHQTGGDPGAGPSRQALADAPNLRVRVLERPPSPFLDPLTYWLMEPSDPATSSRSHRETLCALHGWGSCPYPVASRRLNLSSPSLREEEKGLPSPMKTTMKTP